jgi:hypothetical protein
MPHLPYSRKEVRPRKAFRRRCATSRVCSVQAPTYRMSWICSQPSRVAKSRSPSLGACMGARLSIAQGPQVDEFKRTIKMFLAGEPFFTGFVNVYTYPLPRKKTHREFNALLVLPTLATYHFSLSITSATARLLLSSLLGRHLPLLPQLPKPARLHSPLKAKMRLEVTSTHLRSLLHTHTHNIKYL